MSDLFIDVDIVTDPQDIMDDFVSFMQTIVPGWEPAEGNLDTWLAQAMSLQAAESRAVAASVPRSIFRYFGASLINLPPIDDTAATASTTWTAVDNAGYTIPAGTQVSIAKTGDEVFAFETTTAAVIPPGSTSVTGVTIIAVTPGADSTNLGLVGGTVQLIDPLTFVASITQANPTSGGVDAETDDDYLARLTSYLQLLAPRPILASDFAVFARNIAGVARATAVDGYDPVTATFGNSRTVAVAAIDEDGNAVSTAVKGAIAADLSARREINFVVNVIDPTINLVNVTYKVAALSGYDPTALITSINAALTAYLSPATWGSTVLSAKDWFNLPIVRYLEVSQIINAVPGVDYITTTGGQYDLTIAINGSGLARADLAMTGVAPLPDANTLIGSVA